MTSSSEPHISVVIPTHNGRESVRTTVEALLGSSHHNLEVIVVTDGDASVTRNLLESLGDPRLKIIERPKSGAATTRNAGLHAATSTWVAFMDDDDVPKPGWAQVWRQPLMDPNCAAATASVAVWQESKRLRTRRCRLDPTDPAMSASTLLAGAFVVRRDLLLAIGGYDTTLWAAQNQDLGLRLCDHLKAADPPVHIFTLEDEVMDIHVELTATRDQRYGTARADAARHFFERHADRLRNDPGHAASLLRIIARSERKRGQLSAARFASWRAVRLAPRNLHNWRSLTVSLIPQLETLRRWLPRLGMSGRNHGG